MISNMLQNSKILVAGLVLAFMGLALAVIPTPVQAADTASQAVCEGLGAAFDGEGCVDAPGGSTIDNTISNIVNVLSVLVAVVAVFMIIIAGLRYVTSGGESSAVSGAKNQIMYALVGLIIVALAQVLVKFTINQTSTTPSTSSEEVVNPEPCVPGSGQPC